MNTKTSSLLCAVIVFISPVAIAADGSWNVTGGGNWGTNTNWTGDIIADGTDFTATFGNVITGNSIINLEADRTIGNIVASDTGQNYTISGANILTLDVTSGVPVIDVTTTNRTLAITSVIAGNDGLQKNGAGILDLRGATNTYSGNTILNGGQLTINSDANLGNTAGDIVFAANSTLRVENTTSLDAGRNITINNGVTATLTSTNNAKTFNGVLEGSGTLFANHSTSFIFANAANTFTGAIRVSTANSTSYGLDVYSLLDEAGNGNISLENGTFRWFGSGGTKTFDDRQFILANNNQSGTIINRSTDSSTLVIANNLGISGTGSKSLTLGGTSLGIFSGNITDGTATVSLNKTEGNTWALGGTNSYTGITNLVANGTTGHLIFQGAQSLSPFTTIAFNQNSSNVQSISLLDDGTGTINFQRPITFTGANTTQVMNIFVGNNNTANGGSSSGTTTGSTIQIGDITWNNATQSGNNKRTFNLTGANGYSLRTGDFILPNLSTRTAGGVWTNAMNPTTATLVIGGNITMASGNNVDGGIPVLELGGTSTGNQVLGAISNAADAATTNRYLSVTKTGSSDWTLSGANTYTGDTTVSAGTLTLSTTGELLFDIGANGVNNAILGTGTLVLDGTLVFDLTDASTTISDLWNIVDVGSLNETYDTNFSVSSLSGSFSETAGVWTIAENGVIYEFTESTGQLTVLAPVPEPSPALMLGIAGVFMLLIRRKR